MARWDLLHIITKLELGGAQLATLHQVAHSQRCGGRRVLITGPGGLLMPEARALGDVEHVEIAALARPIAPTRDLRAAAALARLLGRLRRGAPLLVHTHSSKAGVLGRWAAALAGAERIVHSIHGFGHTPLDSPLRRAALLGAERATARVTDGFAADSAANLEQARRERILTDQPHRVVRCAIPVEAYAAPRRPADEVRAALGVGPNQPVVLGLFCLKPQKDPQTFVRVAYRVRARSPDAVFWLAGDGEERGTLERLIALLGLEQHVRLLGWRRDVADLLHAADLLLHTSRWEGLPQVFPQAMAAGRPVVATDVDGAPEAIVDGETGRLAPVGAVEALADAVLELLADPARRARFGAAGRARVAAFADAQMISDLDVLYDQVIARPPRRPDPRLTRR